MKRYTSLLLAVLMVFALTLNVGAAETRASAYLGSYIAYVEDHGDGQIVVYFEVDSAGGYMDEIGASMIRVQESTDNENWTTKATYTYDEYPEMMALNDYSHIGDMTYEDGITGRYYRASVTIYAGKGTGGSSRTVITDSVRCR